ncbi:MAG: Uncharacterized protein FD135_2389 [Comamonadaceae bacterium]|nr:MAG: Uncharacterized protein FD135_2389 [Comamonadaceae bacterium]
MKHLLMTLAALTLAGSALAQQYNTVPTDDVQYMQCLIRVNKLYDGGDAKSPIAGQNKAQAYCSCLWNETPDDFRGNLSKFADSERGKKLDKLCAKYSNWE